MHMMTITRRIGTTVLALGLDPRRLLTSLRFLPTFLRQAISLWAKSKQFALGFPIRWVPILSDRYMPGGTAKGHYFHQDLWAARHIFNSNPKEHIDVGSRIDGFIAHLLTFRRVKVLDVRPLVARVDGLVFEQADLMGDIPDSLSADSVSCLHALEHFGLGRYGDPLDLDGWKKGLSNLAKIVRVGGYLYLSVPIGNEQCIEFNAQRIFAPTTVVAAGRACGLEMIEFSYINDSGDFVERTDPQGIRCEFGCGCYLFQRSVAAA
jgi:hypothetical protein